MMKSTAPVRFPRVILGTCVVPWREDESCDEPLFRRTIRDAAINLTRHLYIFGTAGEGHAVTDRQFAAVTRVFVDEMKGAGGTPMVGVISLSLGTIIERIAFARDLGVREFQISLPAWGALNDAELDRFFAETCGRFPELSFLHYNLGRSRRILTGSDYQRLALRHPNLVAIKMSGEIAALRSVAAALPMVRCFFTEFGFISLADDMHCGLLCSLSVCAPDLGRRLFAGTTSERGLLEGTLRAIHSAVKNAVGSDAHMDGAYDKLFVKYHFPEFPLRLLAPYQGAKEDSFAAFRAACDAALRNPNNRVTEQAAIDP